jgi:hypothetical protein
MPNETCGDVNNSPIDDYAVWDDRAIAIGWCFWFQGFSR